MIIGALAALAFDAYRGRRQVVKYAGLPVSRRTVEADPDLTRLSRGGCWGMGVLGVVAGVSEVRAS